MIGSPNQDQRSAVIAQLNASIDSFFLEGGSVQTLPGFKYVPHRPHRDLEPIRASSESPSEPKLTKRQKQLADLRKLAATMCYAEAMQHTGLSQSALSRAAADGGFHFQPNPNRGKGNKGKKLSDPVKDRELAERITAARDIGLTMAQVVRRMHISYKLLHRILQEFGISYPTTAENRAKRKA